MTDLSTLTLARLYAAQGSFDRALRIYDLLMAEAPGDATVLEERESLLKRMAGGNGGGPETLSDLDSDIHRLEGWLALLQQDRE